MLLAMFAMVMLTFIVGVTAFVTRVMSVRAGHAKAGHFLLMNAKSYPEAVIKTTRNFNLQFEVPVLFYTVAILFVVLKLEDSASLVLAWSFVALRYVHALIHITYNKLLYRLLVFWASVLVVMGLWIFLIVKAQSL